MGIQPNINCLLHANMGVIHVSSRKKTGSDSGKDQSVV
jgi:hypothetical protein